MKKLLLITLLSASFGANAATFVGSYNVQDGPVWTTNPNVYSAQEAAALVFGGSASDYAISILSSLDESTITNTAHYDGWGDHTDRIFAENFKLDFGAPGYNDPNPLLDPTGFLDSAGFSKYAYSAYVNDGINATNYVWRVAAVPEPETYAMMLAGLGLMGFVARRRKEGQV
ncbi:MAG: PEP-CTERM sorting domain-containing protein [Methylotenera sp.]|nr:PEP-CTERM sorting domain-containing protein [Methylotenera sp.]